MTDAIDDFSDATPEQLIPLHVHRTAENVIPVVDPSSKQPTFLPEDLDDPPENEPIIITVDGEEIAFDPETGEEIPINKPEEEETKDDDEITDEENILEPEIDSCNAAIEACDLDNFFPEEKSPYLLESIILGILAEVEIVLPIVFWFALIKPSIEGITYNLNYSRAWYGIWVGLLLSYAVQGIVWPITYFVKDSLFLDKFYTKSWLYLGQIGRHAVDFYVLISLIIAAIDF